MKFNHWANSDSSPSYLNTVRLVGLSKEGNESTPATGNIRFIAIGNAIEKFYQTILLQKLNEEITNNKLISNN